MHRTIKLAVVALVATAIISPSAAFAGGKAHLMGSYKVEEHIDLEGEDGYEDVSCQGTDIAVDGMWRIDNVDQDNDFSYYHAPTGQAKHDVLLSAETVGAYPLNSSTYRFEFVPTSGGDVQGKLFLTCLPREVTKTNGHTHTWTTEAVTTNDVTIDDPANSGDTYGIDTGSSTECDAGEIAIAPGFKVNTAGAFVKVNKREPSSYSASSGWRKWDWAFFNMSASDTSVKLYQVCLVRKSSGPVPGPGTHAHKIAAQTKYNPTPNPTTIFGDRVTEVQVNCGEHYKAMLAAWDFGYDGYDWDNTVNPANTPPNHAQKLWYMGMDPRPKSRTFKILNTGLANVLTALTSTGTPPAPDPVSFSSLCFKTKTT